MLDRERSNILLRERSILKALEPAVIQPYLLGDYAALHATLNHNRKTHLHWVYLTFKNNDGKLFYPLSAPPAPAGDHLITVSNSLDWGEEKIGNITLIVRWDKEKTLQMDQIRSIEFLALVLFGGILTAGALWQTLWIRQPILKLQDAAQKLAKNDFEADLPKTGNDELGQLTSAFNKMRNDILLAQENLKKAIQEAELKKREAEKANRAKSEFLSRMSHELRTPLNAVLGFAQILEIETRKKQDTSQRASIQQILNGGKHLLELVNEILDLARIESGKYEFSQEEVALDPAIEDVVIQLKPLSDNYDVQVTYSNPEGYNPIILMDPMRFKQSLINLISNAIKYNKPGGQVNVLLEIKNSQAVNIKVIDTGKGISQENLKYIFEPFERLNYGVESIEGTGIGLTITKQLVEKMNGTLEVESELGKGSCFTLTFPVLQMNDENFETQLNSPDRGHNPQSCPKNNP
ncbi:MAG: HAMP domain-containing protein [candidate division Zixibacteria bacterium]|nr:HAMP domain-containing histidine kinase [candidate division KSB1 bacterium]NIS44541.1 HAMP domain-containing histidine kinase [candidate division Zixibacteria bacterium]NIT73506.1 HAMP domain-containing histidine kinase [candidate division KSB1 bacterium]NIV04714.1 HAMP domain-containing protein [candidate division Zixibacteria bacterium]NIW71819.1 HAMP domain-containing protein [candidate division KSB1 bacterium]